MEEVSAVRPYWDNDEARQERVTIIEWLGELSTGRVLGPLLAEGDADAIAVSQAFYLIAEALEGAAHHGNAWAKAVLEESLHGVVPALRQKRVA